MHIDKIRELEEVLRTNANTDWSENDPNQEFLSLADSLKNYLPSRRSMRLGKLREFVSIEDDSELEKMLDIIDKVEPKDIDAMVDYLEGFQITEQFEYTFTVKGLLQQIS